MTQPTGNGGGFTRADLTKFIGSTENKYFVMIPKDRWLQVLHSAFVLDKWVYTSTSCSGVDDYWMRIPVKSLLNPIKSLDLNVTREEGAPVAGRKLPLFQGLTNKSGSLLDFLDKNKLMEVLIDVAKKSTRSASATLISGALYSIPVKYAGSQENDQGFPLAPYHTLQVLRQFGCPTVWTQNLIISFIS